jgi:hypothetical protein
MNQRQIKTKEKKISRYEINGLVIAPKGNLR